MKVHIPAEGEVWATRTKFCWGRGLSGEKRLRPGMRNITAEYPEWDAEGYETRTVVAVVYIKGYQRRIIYTRQFAPDGQKPFGNRNLHMTTLSSFNIWCKRADLIQASLIDRASKELERQKQEQSLEAA